MKSLPTIHVVEFAGPETSYRIPLYRARNYWEFLEHLHNTFDKPWEICNAHLHLDNGICDSRISPSEWDAGAYFAPEFAKDGRLNLCAHFEEVGARTRDDMAGVQSCPGEQWQWGWHGDCRSNDEWYRAQKYPGDAVERWKQDPYPPFPERLPLDDAVYVTKVNTPQPSTAAAPPTPHPRQNTEEDFVIVDETTNPNLRDNGIVIGHAKAHWCCDPRNRPAARATMTLKGSLVAYISAKHSKEKRIGDLQIPLKEIDYIAPFNTISNDNERKKAIKDALPASCKIKCEPGTPCGSAGRIMTEGLVIGHAKPECSSDPSNPPAVRAVLSGVGAVICYVEAMQSTKSLLNGLAQVQLEDVVCGEVLMEVKLRDRGKVIKKMILERREGLIDGKEEENEQAVATKKREKGSRQRKVKEKTEID